MVLLRCSPDSKATIKKANDYGVIVKMITGDHQLVAVETSKALELGRGDIMQCTHGELPTIDLSGGKLSVPPTLGHDFAGLIMSKDGFSQALPEHKFVIVEALKQAGYIVGMTGDGVNDAPALKNASVGIVGELILQSADSTYQASYRLCKAPRMLLVRQHTSFLLHRVSTPLSRYVPGETLDTFEASKHDCDRPLSFPGESFVACIRSSCTESPQRSSCCASSSSVSCGCSPTASSLDMSTNTGPCPLSR